MGWSRPGLYVNTPHKDQGWWRTCWESTEVVSGGQRVDGWMDGNPCGDYYLLPAGGTTWSRSLGLVRFQIFLMTARSSSLAWSMLPSVLILSEVRTRAKSVALNMTVPSLFRGMFMLTRRWNTRTREWSAQRRQRGTSTPLSGSAEVGNSYVA